MAPKHPALYRLDEHGRVKLLFGRCGSCEALTFPANAYGCRVCGAPDLQPVDREATGTLIAAVTLHADLIPGLPAPQVVGDVELAPGIVEEVLIAGVEPDVGAALTGYAHPLGDDLFELRFRAAS